MAYLTKTRPLGLSVAEGGHFLRVFRRGMPEVLAGRAEEWTGLCSLLDDTVDKTELPTDGWAQMPALTT
jgi:hypothetical protein